MKTIAALALLALIAPMNANAEPLPTCRFSIPAGTGRIAFSLAQVQDKCKPDDQLVLLNARSDYPESAAFDIASQACDAQKPIVFSSNRTSFICTYRTGALR